MRKFALILFMCLFPLQVVWAGAADYCTHENDKVTQHFGHHADEHQHSYDTDDDGQQPGNSDLLQDHCCHLSGFIGLFNTYSLAALPSLHLVVAFDLPIYPSLLPDKPERPKWAGLA